MELKTEVVVVDGLVVVHWWVITTGEIEATQIRDGPSIAHVMRSKGSLQYE
jgi:hypothetical protein